jgi:predicted DNA-binding transcriptional regulator AlpA
VVRPQPARARKVPRLRTRTHHTQRARAYLLTDEKVSETVRAHAANRPAFTLENNNRDNNNDSHDDNGDETSPNAARESSGKVFIPKPRPSMENEKEDSEVTLWRALRNAPDNGVTVAELMAATGMSRSTVYRRLARHADAGRAIQVTPGRWRAVPTTEPTDPPGESDAP